MRIFHENGSNSKKEGVVCISLVVKNSYFCNVCSQFGPIFFKIICKISSNQSLIEWSSQKCKRWPNKLLSLFIFIISTFLGQIFWLGSVCQLFGLLGSNSTLQTAEKISVFLNVPWSVSASLLKPFCVSWHKNARPYKFCVHRECCCDSEKYENAVILLSIWRR